MAATVTLRLDTPEETRALGVAAGRVIGPGGYICLYGDLGAGKTTFVQGLAAGLGVADAYITSPSFALVNEYRGRLMLYHIDLYRLSGPEDLHDIGFTDYPGTGVAAVEWPERAGDCLPEDRLDVFIEYYGEGRSIRLAAHGNAYESLLEAICPKS